MRVVETHRPWWLGVAICVAITVISDPACGQGALEPPPVVSGTRECLFVPGTAIPVLAMGVCRPGDPATFRAAGRDVGDASHLEFWAEPGGAGGDGPITTVPLFVPFYVYEKRQGGGTTWYRLGDAYADGAAATARGGLHGWVDGARLEELSGRYAYHFMNPKRVAPGVELYETKAAAYAALAAQQRQPAADDAGENVIVAERLEEEEAWNPLEPGAVPPFVELPDVDEKPVDGSVDPLTDTTLTFPQPAENRLLRIGAVAGGPIDRARLAAMRKESQVRAGVEVAFVIDETLSMKPWFPQVAEFIADNLAIDGDTTNVKVAVSWYSDDPADGPAHDARPLQTILGATLDAAASRSVKQAIVDDVAGHKERRVNGDGTVGELMYRGLGAAIEAAGFTPGENGMVFVVADAPDRLPASDLESLHAALAARIDQLNLQVAFIQVGDRKEPDREFVAQAESLRSRLPPDKQAAVVVSAAARGDLKRRIEEIQNRMEARRRQLNREIERLEARNRFSKPGPVMLRKIAADGLTPEQFDATLLQYYAPAYGWLYHPQQPEAAPQLRAVVFLADPEVAALIATLKALAAGVHEDGSVDGAAAVKSLAEVLATKSRHSQVGRAIAAAWDAMPADGRTFGGFLGEKLGIRARNAILFHRGGAKTDSARRRASTSLEAAANALFKARQRTPPPTWYDAWKVLP